MTPLPAATGAAPASGRCPRCGGGFHCGMSDPGPCPCSTVELSAATLAALRNRYRGCLCGHCLAALAAGAPVQPGPPQG